MNDNVRKLIEYQQKRVEAAKMCFTVANIDIETEREYAKDVVQKWQLSRYDIEKWHLDSLQEKAEREQDINCNDCIWVKNGRYCDKNCIHKPNVNCFKQKEANNG